MLDSKALYGSDAISESLNKKSWSKVIKEQYAKNALEAVERQLLTVKSSKRKIKLNLKKAYWEKELERARI